MFILITKRHNVNNTVFITFDSGVYVFFFFENSIQIQTKMNFKILQFPVVTYGMGVLRCAIDVV